MAVMPNIEAEAARAAGWFGQHLHHASHQPQPEVPMSNLLAEAKMRLHDILADLETVDENAVGALMAAKSNPVAVSIISTVAAAAHLPDPDGLLAAADNMLKVAAAALAHAAQATAAADGSVQPAQPTAAAQPNVIR